MKRSVIRLSGAEYPFENGLFGVNTEITRLPAGSAIIMSISQTEKKKASAAVIS